jgi:hypothetical protein
MEPMSISTFAQRSRLSPTALRLYDEMGLLPPARVDAVTGYRFYEADTWREESGVEPVDLGVRITYLVPPPRTEDSVPDCDVAVPFAHRTT